MLIKLDQPSLLTKAVEIISELVTEVRIRVSEYGMSITAIDPANVAMVGFKLPRSAFSQFESKNEILGVNLDSLKQILKRASLGSSLILETRDNLLEIQIIDKIKRNFTLSLIDIDTDEKEIPALEYSSRVEINSLDLIDSIEDCKVVSDSCSFIIKDNKFIIEAKGLNSAKSEFTSDEIRIEAENCKAKYSLEYLQKFLKAAKLCENSILQFATDHPLRLDFKTSHLELIFILAPRVENDD